MNFSLTPRRRPNRRLHLAAALAVAAMPLLDVAPVYADYVPIGPDGGQWNVPSNWTQADGTGNTVTPIAFYPGDTANGSLTTQIVNINNQAVDGNAHTVFNLGAATANIGRLYVGSTNTGPGSPMTVNGWNAMTIQPQTLTIQSGTMQMIDSERSEVARHVSATVIVNGGTLDVGQVIRMSGTPGVQGVIEYRQGNLYSGVFQNATVGSNPGLRLSDVGGGQGTMKIYNDGPGQVWLRGYYTCNVRAQGGGFASIGRTEFHYNNGGVKTVRIGDSTAGQGNQVSLRNDAVNPSTEYSSPFNFVIDSTPTTGFDGSPNSLALFTTPDVTKGMGTDYAVFYNNAITGRYLDRDSGYDGVSGRIYDPATDSFVIDTVHGGVHYVWDISYTGKGTWDGTFDNITSVTGHATGTDIVLMGRSSWSGQRWTTAADGSWSTGPWDGSPPNAAGAGANFFVANTTGAVNVTVDGNYTVGSLQFDNINRSSPNVAISGVILTSYALSGGSITIQATGGGHGLIRAIDASHSVASPITLASNTRTAVAAGRTLTLDSVQPSGNVTLTNSNPGTLAITALTVPAGTSLKTDGTTAIEIGTLAVDTGGGAKLDVNNAGHIVTNESVNDVRSLLLAGSGGAGFAAQTWDQPGIMSTSAAADPLTYGVGYMDNDNFILGGKATFDGVAVPAGSVLVKSTLSGDADLDWDVDDDDVTVLGIFYGGAGHWYEADFDYTGFVDDDDVTIIGITYGQSLPGAPGGVTAVPEPGSLALLSAAAVAGLRRRRR